MPHRLRLLLIDPDPVFRTALCELFEAGGEVVPSAYGAPGDLAASGPGHIDIVLLSDGQAPIEVETILQIRSVLPNTPILVAGAIRACPDGVEQIERPFRFADLSARLRGMTHAYERSTDGVLEVGPYAFNPGEKTLTPNAGGEDIRLTDKEAAILRYLKRAGAPVGRDELLGEVWGYNSGMTTHTLETHIYRLRQKIEPVPGEMRVLITGEGGYTLGAADASPEAS